MAVNTNFFKHLNALNFVNKVNEDVFSLGVSKVLMVDDDNPYEFNEKFGYTAESINSCSVFTKIESHFVTESNEEDFDVKLLTKQSYGLTSHGDSTLYWKYITPEEAIVRKIYNVILTFSLTNDKTQTSELFNELKTFYLYLNLRVNDNTPVFDKNNQIIPDFEQDVYTADGVISLEKLSYNYNDVNNGFCVKQENSVTVPYSYICKIHYFISF